MSENAQEIPLDKANGHLAEVVGRATLGDRIVYLTDHGRRVAAIVPASEAWYWGPGWQTAEAEADADLAEGRTQMFDSMEEMFEHPGQHRPRVAANRQSLHLRPPVKSGEAGERAT